MSAFMRVMRPLVSLTSITSRQACTVPVRLRALAVDCGANCSTRTGTAGLATSLGVAAAIFSLLPCKMK